MEYNISEWSEKEKTRRNHGGNFTTHLEDQQAVYRYQRKFHHSANNGILFLFRS